MDIATSIGFLASLSTILLSVYLSGATASFVNSSSALIVFMGTLTITLMKFPLNRFISGFKSAGRAFYHRSQSNIDLINEIIGLSKDYKSNGHLNLDVKNIKHDVLKKGAQLIVDGFKPSEVNKILHKDLALTINEQNLGRELFKSIGVVAPAMGMIGTLVGLVQMLANLKDTSALGPAMAIALLTTLYGAILSHAFALPVSAKLGYRIDEEIAQQEIILDGLNAIQTGSTSLLLEEVLHSHLISKEKRLLQ